MTSDQANQPNQSNPSDPQHGEPVTEQMTEHAVRLAGELAAMPIEQAQRRARVMCGDDDALCAQVLRLLSRGRQARDEHSASRPTSLPANHTSEGGAEPAKLESTIDQLLASGSQGDGRDGHGVGAGVGPARVLGLDLDDIQDSVQRQREQVPERLGRYVVDEVIGESSSCVVYRAHRDDVFDEPVAIKVFLGSSSESRSAVVRELRSRTLLDHPCICDVRDAFVCVHFGRQSPCIVMDSIEGDPITTSLCRTTAQEKVRVFLAVCGAISHAHQRGVIHRDLKPSNILVKASDQHPSVLDFGIARVRDDPHVSQTIASRLRGTVGYMAPEQCKGNVTPNGAPFDVRTDIYTLGVVLYELLTEQPAFDLSGLSLPEQLARRNQHNTPLACGADVPKDLRAIVRKATQIDPDQRYQHVLALADDLGAWMDGRPVQARAGNPVYTAVRFLRRHKGGAALAAGLLLSVLAGFIATGIQAARLSVITSQQRDLIDGFATYVTGVIDGPLTTISDTAGGMKIAEQHAVLVGELSELVRTHENILSDDTLHDQLKDSVLLQAARALDLRGNQYLQQANRNEALRVRQEALLIYEQLAPKDPDNLQLQADLSIALVRVGDVASKPKESMEALAFYMRALDIDERILAEDRRRAADAQQNAKPDRQLMDNLVHSYIRLAAVHRHLQSADQHRMYAKKAIHLAIDLRKLYPDHKQTADAYAQALLVQTAEEIRTLFVKAENRDILMEVYEYLSRARYEEPSSVHFSRTLAGVISAMTTMHRKLSDEEIGTFVALVEADVIELLAFPVEHHGMFVPIACSGLNVPGYFGEHWSDWDAALDSAERLADELGAEPIEQWNDGYRRASHCTHAIGIVKAIEEQSVQIDTRALRAAVQSLLDRVSESDLSDTQKMLLAATVLRAGNVKDRAEAFKLSKECVKLESNTNGTMYKNALVMHAMVHPSRDAENKKALYRRALALKTPPDAPAPLWSDDEIRRKLMDQDQEQAQQN